MKVQRVIYGHSIGGSPWLTLAMENGERLEVDVESQKLLLDGHQIVLTQNVEIPVRDYKTKFGSIVRGHFVDDATVVRIVRNACQEMLDEQWHEREEPADRYYA